MGLYGSIVLEPPAPDCWAPVNRKLTLTLDDTCSRRGRVAPFARQETTHVATGRFGTVLLVNGA